MVVAKWAELGLSETVMEMGTGGLDPLLQKRWVPTKRVPGPEGHRSQGAPLVIAPILRHPAAHCVVQDDRESMCDGGLTRGRCLMRECSPKGCFPSRGHHFENERDVVALPRLQAMATAWC